jgi:hypothetical protein
MLGEENSSQGKRWPIDTPFGPTMAKLRNSSRLVDLSPSSRMRAPLEARIRELGWVLGHGGESFRRRRKTGANTSAKKIASFGSAPLDTSSEYRSGRCRPGRVPSVAGRSLS